MTDDSTTKSAPLSATFRPVSYTHLDVYKRQQHDTSPHSVEVGGRKYQAQMALGVLCYSHMLFFQINLRFQRFDCKVFLSEGSGNSKEPYSVKPALTNVAPSCQDGFFIVEVPFEYSAWDASEPSERLFPVNGTFEVSYRLRSNYCPTSEQIASFGRGTVVFNCRP